MRRAAWAASLCVAAATLAHSQSVFRSGIDLVHFEVVVSDRDGGFVTGLTADDFELTEDGRRQAITFFAAGEDAAAFEELPLHVGLLLDTSGSMTGELDLAQTGAIRFLNSLTHAVDITLVDFDSEVRVSRYPQSAFPRMVERIRSRTADGWTALFDALGVYLDGTAGQEGQKVLVIFTDGGDTRSALSFGVLQDLIRASDVTIYAVGFLQRQLSSARLAQRTQLQDIAELTGGQAFFPARADEFEEIFGRIRTELASRYTLGYVSHNTARDGSWRRVRIRLPGAEHRTLRLRARAGYFAPYQEPSDP